MTSLLLTGLKTCYSSGMFRVQWEAMKPTQSFWTFSSFISCKSFLKLVSAWPLNKSRNSNQALTHSILPQYWYWLMLLQQNNESVVLKTWGPGRLLGRSPWILWFLWQVNGVPDSQPLRGWSTKGYLGGLTNICKCHQAHHTIIHFRIFNSSLVIESWTLHDRSSQMKGGLRVGLDRNYGVQ